jgi:MFS family permease
MVIWSTGEHIVLPLKSTISLDLSKKESGGAALGIMNTLYNAGNISGFLIVTIIFFIFEKLGFARISVIPFRVVFCASASLMLAAFLVSLAITETKLKAPRRRLYFSKKFFTFYVLEIFYGARKQVFMTFAPLVLIREYGAPTSLIAILLAVCAGCAMIFSPLIGRLIDKLGYRTIMIADTLILIAVCFFYGFSHRIFPAKIAFVVVCVNYILDSII